MKKLKSIALCVLLSVCFLHSGAQEQKIPINEPDLNKPKLFSDLPQKMNLNIGELKPLFRLQAGERISVRLADNFLFEGRVVSKSGGTDPNIQSIVISSTNRLGATLTFSQTIMRDGSIGYVGRIMSRNNGDMLEIAKENGQYILQKKNLYDLMNE
jgi:hypothetical protein